MERHDIGAILAGLALIAAAAGCGDTTATEPISGETETAEQPVVVPKFEIDGVGQIPDQMVLESLGLTVADVILTPVSDPKGVDYSTRRPIVLGFDVARGDRIRHGRGVRLPETGWFKVSLRVDNADTDPAPQGAGCDSEAKRFSVCMSGLIRDSGILRAISTSSDETNDGDPIPLPFVEFDPGSGNESTGEEVQPPRRWAAFSYRSRETHTFTVDRVRVVEGKQYLRFEFDADEWAKEIAKPVSKAIQSRVENENLPMPDPRGGSSVPTFDVTKEIDRTG
ncbi:MAG: hypothetical protein ABEL76_06220, partial [Bradymonadaceae bacterium]